MGKEEDAESAEGQVASKLKDKKITCRICGGNHWTSQCPYKDNLAALEALGLRVDKASDTPAETPSDATVPPTTAAASAPKPGKYIPPSMRPGAQPSADASDAISKRDEGYALRITNLSPETTDDDLLALTRPFGRTIRSYLSKDRYTNLCRGFAFVNFMMRTEAEDCLRGLDGYGYDNLILKVEWAAQK